MDAIAEVLTAHPLCILNTDSHTRRPTNGTTSSPDVSIISSHLVPAVEWATNVRLNSDHLPISITFIEDSLPPLRIRKTFTNFKLADWEAWQGETESRFSELDIGDSAAKNAIVFNRILNNASKKHIPQGFRKDFISGLTSEVKRLTDIRDNIRLTDPTDPRIPDLNLQIKNSILETSRKSWLEHICSCNHTTDNKKFWTIIRKICGKNINPPPNQPIFFNNRPYNKTNAIAKKFTAQFTSVAPHRSDRSTRKIMRNLHQKHKLDPSFRPFTEDQVSVAIRKPRNSTATGPDNLTSLHLKHLGPLGITFLTHTLNLSVQKVAIPAIWKDAIIIPLLKPGKSADNGKSYHPISLLSPTVKILERLILPYLTTSLAVNSTQHGFRPLHSTTTALLPIANAIATGFNQNKPHSRTATIAIDFAKAFDSVNHPLLLQKVSNSSLHPNLVRWLAAYLRGRTAACLYLSSTSPRKITRSGVPQGSVISPCLFNFFVSDCPTTPLIMTSYADDVTIAEQAPDTSLTGEVVAARLTDSLTPSSTGHHPANSP